ncbi:unnamed protein product, partial [Mesorhabditis belari]|uniref:Uncharacterized protein n=1 Tax=Mesorhabditis belari TaxID=2138241 RepID=A0AAF3EKU9_9BILA
MFWTPNIKKEQLVKLTIGLTSLVSMTVLLQMLSDAIPKTSVFPLLGIYVHCRTNKRHVRLSQSVLLFDKLHITTEANGMSAISKFDRLICLNDRIL